MSSGRSDMDFFMGLAHENLLRSSSPYSPHLPASLQGRATRWREPGTLSDYMEQSHTEL